MDEVRRTETVEERRKVGMYLLKSVHALDTDIREREKEALLTFTRY